MSYEPEPQEWTEKFPFSQELQVIDAPSYRKWLAEVCPQMKGVKPLPGPKICKEGIPIGKFRFGVMEMKTHRMGSPWEGMGIPLQLCSGKLRKMRSTLSIAQGRKRGEVAFTGPVKIPVLHDEFGNVWMSLTPMEVITQRAGVRKAKGRVLMGGLGMGWLARKVCEKKTVKSLVVHEKDKDVANFFGEQLVRDFGRKINIFVKDVYAGMNGNTRKFDTVLMDIWSDFHGAEYDHKFTELVKTHPRVWGWGYHPERSW